MFGAGYTSRWVGERTLSRQIFNSTASFSPAVLATVGTIIFSYNFAHLCPVGAIVTMRLDVDTNVMLNECNL